MKRQTINLRHAFASNPARFTAGLAPGMTIKAPARGQVQSLRQFPLAPQMQVKQPHPLGDRLRELGLDGMAGAFVQLEGDRSVKMSGLTKWLPVLVDSEIADRKEKRLAARVRAAKFRYCASIADVDYQAARGFDDALFHWLANGQWIADRENLIIDGPTGIGKTWLACALGVVACRADRSVRYERVPRLLADLGTMRGTSRYARRMRALHKAELLILDDWGLEPFGPEQCHDMLEITEGRYGEGSTLVASQVAVDHWPQIIGNARVAALILDRIMHDAHRLQLNGESLRPRYKTGEKSSAARAATRIGPLPVSRVMGASGPREAV